MKHLKIFFLLLIVAGSLSAQTVHTSPFKSLKKPSKKYGVSLGANEITAFRFTGSIAGYMYPQNQLVTGLGYGLQKIHFVEATQKYYEDISASLMVYAGGDIQPSLEKHNIISVGVAVGILNQLINLAPVYNFGSAGQKGTFGVVLTAGVPFNN